MLVHARRLLLAGLIAACWGRGAHAEGVAAQPEPPTELRGPAASVPQEPMPSSASPVAPSPSAGPTPSPSPAQPESAAPSIAPSPAASATEPAPANSSNSSNSSSANPSPGAEPAPQEIAAPPPATAARRSIELVPRQFGAALGWSYIARDNLPDALISDPRPHPHGVELDTHVLWQIAGLSRRWPIWIGPQLGLDVFPATAVSRRVIALGYGLRIKHQFGRHPRIRPYLSYGLGAVQTWVKTIDSREVGHQTRISLGTALPVGGGLSSLTLALVYKHQGLATFRWDEASTLSYSFHTVGIVLGMVFDAKPRRSRPRNRPPARSADATKTPRPRAKPVH